MIAYVLPTHNRHEVLAQTLGVLARLPAHDAELIIVDNASRPPLTLAADRLANGLPVRLLRLEENDGAAARNAGAEATDPSREWLVMLDDDSSPLDLGYLDALKDASPDVAAVAAEIFLPDGSREAGGLPEVFIGCGVAVRRDDFLHAEKNITPGYDPDFHYYVEEYDLAARFLLRGKRVVLDRRFRVEHRKVAAGRDMNAIIRRLARNNGWVIQRYAPGPIKSVQSEIRRMLERYRGIAKKENADVGYAMGRTELAWTLRRQPRRAMSTVLWDRFTGLTEARRSIKAALLESPFTTACIVSRGKNDHLIERALTDLGVTLVDSPDLAHAWVIGTLSPGPLMDAWDKLEHAAHAQRARLVSPWRSLVEQHVEPITPSTLDDAPIELAEESHIAA